MYSVRYFFHDALKLLAAPPGLLWLRPKLVYESDAAKKHIKGGAIVVSNHIGYLDPVYLQFAIWYRRHHFVCLKEFFEGRAAPLFRFFLCIPIDREDVGMDTMRRISSELSAGEIVSMFPEGHISEEEDKRMNSFKSGMVLMAMMGKSPIVPVYIKPKKHFYNRLVMAIGEPVDVCGILGGRPSIKEINAVAKIVEEREENLKNIL